MDGHFLAERFEAERERLRSVAYRLLGSAGEADDAVQEAWLRLNRAEAGEIENLRGWLTTVVARICLDMLRSRRTRREQPLAEALESIPDTADPEAEAVISDSVGLAMRVVMQRLGPAERVAFVLHDVFGISFEEIAPIVGRTPVAARQLASRGRRRVQGVAEESSDDDVERQRRVVQAFFRASHAGDFGALLAVLDPDVMLRADETALHMGARNGWLTAQIRGAEAVARQFAGRAQAAQLALIDGHPGAAWAHNGRTIVVFSFKVRDGRVAEIELLADPQRLSGLSIEIQA